MSVMRCAAVLLAAVFLQPAVAAADCEAYWYRIEGQDERQVLRLPRGFPLSRFTSSEPASAANTLSWLPVTQPPSVRLVGRLRGKPIHYVKYSEGSVALLTEHDGLFCPTLLLAADTRVLVAFIGEPQIFRWQNTELLSLRVYYQGNGAQQESLLFTDIGGAVVHLDWELPRYPKGAEPSSHGGGFCDRSLVWEVPTGGNSPQHGIIRLRYRVRGRHLEVTSADLVKSADQQAPCTYYEQRLPR